MNLKRICAAGAASVLLGGCNLAPHYRVPEAGAPAQFKEAPVADSTRNEGWKVAQPDDRELRGNCWELYGDSQLNELEERVAKANQSVIAAEAAFVQARSLVAEARAQYFPTVSANPAVTRSRSSASVSNLNGNSSNNNNNTGTSGTNSTAGTQTTGTTTTGTVSAPGTHTIYSLPFDASYTLDLWGSIRNTVKQNKALAEASADNLANALLSMQAELAEDYFELRSVDEQRLILDSTLADYRASLSLAQTLYRTGINSEEDLDEAETQLDDAEAQATDLGIQRGQYEHAIAVLVGVAPAQFSLSVQRFVPKIPQIPLIVPSQLLERRPDVAAAERQVAAANAEIGVARAAFFPTLSLSGSAGFEATSITHWFEWPNRFWSVGPTLAQTLFDGGLRFAENEHARAAYDQTVAQYRQTVLGAFQAVEDNLVSLRVLAKESVQQHNGVTAAEKTVKLSVLRYQQGVDSYITVITNQNTFLTSREAELSVQLRQVTASIQLIENLGGGWRVGDESATEAMASHAPRSAVPDAKAEPQDTIAGVPNPPPLPVSIQRPEDLLKQDEDDMAPVPPAR